MALGKPILIAAFVFVHCFVAAAQTAPKITGFLVDGVKSNRAAVMGFSFATLGGIPLAGAGVTANWSDTSIVAVIPATVESGPVVVDVLEQGHFVPSNRRYLNIQVEITGILCNGNPCNSAPVGTPVTLTGNGFGGQCGSCKVTFNGVEAVIDAWLYSSVFTTVPAGATTGPIRVTAAGHVSNGWHFTITP